MSSNKKFIFGHIELATYSQVDIPFYAMKCFGRFLILIFSFYPAMAFELGHYSGKEPRFQELADLIENADRTIGCSGIAAIGRYSLGSDPRADGLKNLTINDLDEFLKKERHKNCLVIVFNKGVLSFDDEKMRKEELDDVADDFKRYGYGKIILIQANSHGGISLLRYYELKLGEEVGPRKQD